ncbi:MAG: hypothetical protein CMH83_18685 [Nocardioides sp.]|nr:hypothetical protein [Nocardioides sp.]
MRTPRLALATSTAGAVALAGLLVPSSPAAAAPVVGAQTVGDTLFPNVGNGGYDVTDYDVTIDWAASGSIDATTTIAATTTGDPLSEFSLDLEGLTVDAVTVDGAEATFTRVQDEASTTFKLVVTPAAPVDGAFTVVVDYSGTPDSHTDPDGSSEGWVATPDGAVAVNEPVGAMTWFPGNHTPRDKATFSAELTVPYNPILPATLNRSAVSNGVLDGIATTASTRTFTWTQANQQATYLALVGIGFYSTATSDVALTTGTTPEWSYADPTAAGALTTNFTTSRGLLSEMLQSIEGYYGPYPGVSTGFLLDVSSLGYALETQDRPYFETTINRGTLIHELAHQWFGNAVSPTDWSDIWLNEGPAEFITTQVEHDLYDGDTTEDTYFAAWSSTSESSSNWDTPPAGFDDPADLFGWQVYTRGAMALEALRSAIGTEAFIDTMNTWYARHQGADGSTAEFTAIAEEVSGKDLDAFFTDWLYEGDKPAWPASWTLGLSSTPDPATPLTIGDEVSFTLSAANVGKVALGGQQVSVDVSGLVDDADLGALPAGLVLDGTTLTWTVPETPTAATSTATFTATVSDDAASGPLGAVASTDELGGVCGECAAAYTVELPELISADPMIRGRAQVGRTVRVGAPGWTDGTTFAVQWLRDGRALRGATAATYQVKAGDLGHRLTARVTGTLAGYEPVTRSATTRKVARGEQRRQPLPRIKGKPRVGPVLRVAVGRHDAGTTVRTRWYVGGKALQGKAGKARRLKVRKSYRGKQVWVTSVSTQRGYFAVRARSSKVRIR